MHVKFLLHEYVVPVVVLVIFLHLSRFGQYLHLLCGYAGISYEIMGCSNVHKGCGSFEGHVLSTEVPVQQLFVTKLFPGCLGRKTYVMETCTLGVFSLFFIVWKTKCWACDLNAAGLGGVQASWRWKLVLECIPGFLVSGRHSSHVFLCKNVVL